MRSPAQALMMRNYCTLFSRGDHDDASDDGGGYDGHDDVIRIEEVRLEIEKIHKK